MTREPNDKELALVEEVEADWLEPILESATSEDVRVAHELRAALRVLFKHFASQGLDPEHLRFSLLGARRRAEMFLEFRVSAEQLEELELQRRLSNRRVQVVWELVRRREASGLSRRQVAVRMGLHRSSDLEPAPRLQPWVEILRERRRMETLRRVDDFEAGETDPSLWFLLNYSMAVGDADFTLIRAALVSD